MKARSKENSKSKNKVIQKKNSNGNEKKYNNPFYPIKYFCFNDVKKIVNNKHKKSPFSKNNEKLKNMGKNEKSKKEEEDDYDEKVYNKKLILPFNSSCKNLSRNIFYLDKYKIKNDFRCFSTDKRYKALKIYGLFTKKIIFNIKKEKRNKRKILIFKKSKFSKNKTKKKFIKNKTKLNNYKYIDINEISNTNNLICRAHTINDFDNNLTNNNFTSKITPNNAMNNYIKSNLINNSMPNKIVNKNKYIVQKIKNNIRNNVYMQINKINNIKIINNISKSNVLRSQNRNNDENSNNIYVRRIVLEEKFTIDSKGDKKTIYIKKINSNLNTKEIINSHEKRKKNKIKKRNNFKDNSYLNHNDINVNMNACSFQKININKKNINKLLHMNPKMDSYDEESKALSNNNNFNNSNNNNPNITILQNYKYYLNIKNGNKICRPKPNGILYKSENNRKSHQNLFQNASKRILNPLNHSELIKGKKKAKSKNKMNHSLNANANKKNKKKNKNKNLKYNSPLKYMNMYPQCFKNKVIHRKTKTNCIIPNNNEDNKLIPEEDTESLSSQRSLSFLGRIHLNNVTKKIKNGKKKEKKDKKENFNNINTSRSGAVLPYSLNKMNNYFHVSSPKDEINSKNYSKIITFANGNYNINGLKKTNNSYKSKANVNDIINDSSKFFFLNNNKSKK